MKNSGYLSFIEHHLLLFWLIFTIWKGQFAHHPLGSKQETNTARDELGDESKNRNTPPDNKALLFKLDVNLSQTEKHEHMKGALLFTMAVTAHRLSFCPHQEIIIMWKVILLSGTFTPTSCHQHSCFSRVNKGLEEEWQVVSAAPRKRRTTNEERETVLLF